MTYEPETADRLATLGGRLRAVRLAKGLTTNEVAARLKVSRPTFTTWELNHVQKVPDQKVEAFAKFTGVPLNWLKHATGTPPNLPLDVPDRAFVGMRKSTIRQMHSTAAADAVTGGTEVAEIKPTMSAHATGLDIAPQAKWGIPREVLTLGFNCDPEQAVIKRVKIGYTAPDGTPVLRGDYVLIDASRNVVSEPGIYYVADPDRREAKRVIVNADEQTGELIARLPGRADPVSIGELEVLGRAMAVFHSI